jgi:hypothetical protein
MAGGEAGDGAGGDEEAVWLLAGAAWPLLNDGSADALRALAARDTGGGSPALAARLARRMLADLGLEEPGADDAVANARRRAA